MSPSIPTTILLVDDDSAVCQSLAMLLEDLDFTVYAAATEEAALAILFEHSCHVAIVDLRLAQTKGEILITKLNRMYPELRFVIHTGSVAFHLTNELEQIGMSSDDILLKPLLDLKLLITAIDRVRSDQRGADHEP